MLSLSLEFKNVFCGMTFQLGSNLERIAVYTANKYIKGGKDYMKDVKHDVEFKVSSFHPFSLCPKVVISFRYIIRRRLVQLLQVFLFQLRFWYQKKASIF